jgi:hypothetical protein
MEAGHGIPRKGKFSHTCFAIADERQTLVLQGIQVILLVRLVALVSNRPSALGPPSLKYTPPFFMDSGARQRMDYCWRSAQSTP